MSYRSFVALWAVLTASGLAVGAVVGFGLAEPLEALIGMMLVTPVIMAIIGVSTGVSQSMLVRRILTRPLWWIAASAVGLSIGLTAGVVLVEYGSRAIAGRPVSLHEVSPLIRALSFAVIGMISGLFLGAGQWSVLRLDVSQRAGRRIFATTLGLGGGLMLGSFLADLISRGVTTPLGFATLLLAAGGISGVSTGKVLAGIPSSQGARP